MKPITSRVNKISSFFDSFDESWRNAQLQTHQRERLSKILSEIDTKLTLKNASLNELFDIQDAGVRHTSDLITYLCVSRLAYNLDISYNPEKHQEELADIKEMYSLWFDIINYLLITNIFSPNDNIDKIDIGTGKYDDIHKDTRSSILKEILNRSDLFLDSSELFDLIIKNGHILKPELMILANDLNLSTSLKRDQLIITINDYLKTYRGSAVKNWIKNSLNDTNWDALILQFMNDRTPSFLLKNVGLAREIFVFAYLTYTDIGYVIPLLLHQKLFSNYKDKLLPEQIHMRAFNVLDPPDFMIIKKGRIFGVELGRGKPGLISSFAAVSGLPTVYVTPILKGNKKMGSRDFGFKCNICHLSYTICEKYVELFTSGQINDNYINDKPCVELCGEYKCKLCHDAVVRRRFQNEAKNIDTVVHYNCLLKIHPDDAEAISLNEIFPLFPSIEGLNEIRLGL
jgi:hypothetical protein